MDQTEMSKFRLSRIPLLPQPFYTQPIAIDGYRYNFDFQWNRRTNTHYLTITDSFGKVNLQRKKLIPDTTFSILNLPSNSYWFLAYVNNGNNTIFDKPLEHGLGAYVFE